MPRAMCCLFVSILLRTYVWMLAPVASAVLPSCLCLRRHEADDPVRPAGCRRDGDRGGAVLLRRPDPVPVHRELP